MKKLVILAILLAAVGLTACSKQSASFKAESKITNTYQKRLDAAVPYPLAQMHDSQERRNLRERLLRFNSPDKIGYVYLISLGGEYIGYYAIKGKVSSTESQMTITQQFQKPCGNCGWDTLDSMGDDGSYGHNEGGPNGVFFFTTNGVLVETDQYFVYSDSPLPVHAPNLNPNQGQKNVSNLYK